MFIAPAVPADKNAKILVGERKEQQRSFGPHLPSPCHQTWDACMPMLIPQLFQNINLRIYNAPRILDFHSEQPVRPTAFVYLPE